MEHDPDREYGKDTTQPQAITVSEKRMSDVCSEEFEELERVALNNLANVLSSRHVSQSKKTRSISGLLQSFLLKAGKLYTGIQPQRLHFQLSFSTLKYLGEQSMIIIIIIIIIINI